jgi:mono/diheme cytochrome c family protein
MALGLFIAAITSSAGVMAEEPRFKTAPVAGEHQNFRNLYLLRCAACHGANGEGTDKDWPRLAPALKGNPFVQRAPAAAVISVIRMGRTGEQRLYHESYPNMPAFGAEAVFDVDGLVNFLQNDLQK